MKLRPFPPMPQWVADAVNARGADAHSPSGQYDLHHCLLTKNDVKGMPDEVKAMIHHPCNILKIPSEWNASHARIPTRDRALKMLRRHYTFHTIHAWYSDTISHFKNGAPFRLPED